MNDLHVVVGTCDGYKGVISCQHRGFNPPCLTFHAEITGLERILGKRSCNGHSLAKLVHLSASEGLTEFFTLQFVSALTYLFSFIMVLLAIRIV